MFRALTALMVGSIWPARPGQTRQVTITRLIMRHTIEEKMMALKEQKQKLYRAILEEGSGGNGAGLTREDLDFLLG